MDESNSNDKLDYVFGILSIIVVAYRIAFIMYPMAATAIRDKDMSLLFKSFTLIV